MSLSNLKKCDSCIATYFGRARDAERKGWRLKNGLWRCDCCAVEHHTKRVQRLLTKMGAA